MTKGSAAMMRQALLVMAALDAAIRRKSGSSKDAGWRGPDK
jgi:hypothetical protein